ncbi:helix-turn-helix domain-containing protein, partial [Amycolatopsis sp. cmx-4-61]|uniref:helix-turn-helix domain-containing protein n=1 Tax=Amycolatopsis sp. cmx-4-61 TaxID=2790937 RepID=UPI00397CD30B
MRLLDMTLAGRNPGRIISGVCGPLPRRTPASTCGSSASGSGPGGPESEYPACAQHEALINHVFAGRWMTILCLYDAASLRPVAPADAVRRHPWLADGAGVWRASGAYSPKTAPTTSCSSCGRYLSFAEREEIALLRAQDIGVREIARRISRDPGTISRELRR